MTTYMGTPYERGKSDVIVTRQSEEAIEEGMVVCSAGGNNVAVCSAGKIPYGIMGKKEIAGSSVVLKGLKVKAQTDDAADPELGAQVYVNPTTGKVTATEDAMIPTNATFAGGLETDGQVTNKGTVTNNKKCVLIDFASGM